MLSKLERRIMMTAGILLIIACLIVVGIGGFLLFDAVQRQLRPSQDTATIVAEPNHTIVETFRLSSPQTLPGSSKLVFSLSAKQESAGLISKEKIAYSQSRNYLIFDYKTNEGQWLWETNDQVVLRREVLGLKQTSFPGDDHGSLTQAKYLAITYVAKDTTGDGRLSSADKNTLKVYDIAAASSKTVIDSAKTISTVKQLPDLQLLVVYEDGGKTFVLVYDLEKSTVVSTKVLKFKTKLSQ